MVDNVSISDSAISSVAAVLSKKDYSKERKAFYEIFDKCVVKHGGHHEPVATSEYPHRLYTITTIAPTPATGGTRTPVICDKFSEAKEIVENNIGDIWECSYMLVVIEMVPANHLYCRYDGPAQVYWYKWTHLEDYELIQDGQYVAIEVPLGMEDNTFHPIG